LDRQTARAPRRVSGVQAEWLWIDSGNVTWRMRATTRSGRLVRRGRHDLAGSVNSGRRTARAPRPVSLVQTGWRWMARDNVYVADRGNNKIRKIDSAGIRHELWPAVAAPDRRTATGTAASSIIRVALAVDAWATSTSRIDNSNKIRKISSAGVVTTLAAARLWIDGRPRAPQPVSIIRASGGGCLGLRLCGGSNTANKIRKIDSAGRHDSGRQRRLWIDRWYGHRAASFTIRTGWRWCFGLRLCGGSGQQQDPEDKFRRES